MVNRNILPGRGDPNPNPAQLDGFAPEQSSTASFRKSLMKRSEYEANRDAKGARLRDHLVAASGEFVGTVLFLYFAFAWQLIAISQQNAAGAGGTPSSEQVMYIAVGYGFSLLVNAWAFYRISGGLFNPAVRSRHPFAKDTTNILNRSYSAWSSPEPSLQCVVSGSS